MGKTFRNGMEITGNPMLMPDKQFLDVFVYYKPNVQTLQNRISFSYPEGYTYVREYAYFQNINPVDFYLPSDLIETGNRSFYNCKNFNFVNFGSLTHLTTIGEYCFADSPKCLDLTHIPASVKTLKDYCFHGSVGEGGDVVIPSTITSFGSRPFANGTFRACGTLVMPDSWPTNLLTSCFFIYTGFDADLIIPSGVTQILSQYNHNGTFNHVITNGNITSIGSQAFGATGTNPASRYHFKYMVLKETTPPTLANTNAFATQHLTNGIKFYVPDESVQAYKTASNWSYFADYIYPMSEKPVDPAKTSATDKKVTITLDADGGTVDVNSVVEEYGQLFSHLPTPTKQGYTFAGWYSEQNLKRENGKYCGYFEPTTLKAHWTAV